LEEDSVAANTKSQTAEEDLMNQNLDQSQSSQQELLELGEQLRVAREKSVEEAKRSIQSEE
jgi:hypothetical protein